MHNSLDIPLMTHFVTVHVSCGTLWKMWMKFWTNVSLMFKRQSVNVLRKLCERSENIRVDLY